MASKYVGKQTSIVFDVLAGIILATEGNPDPEDADGNLIVYDTPIFHETWAHMEKLYESGKAKAIGVSNFSVKK